MQISKVKSSSFLSFEPPKIKPQLDMYQKYVKDLFFEGHDLANVED